MNQNAITTNQHFSHECVALLGKVERNWHKHARVKKTDLDREWISEKDKAHINNVRSQPSVSANAPYTFSVMDSNSEYQSIRTKIATQFASQYSGWSDVYDRQFDDYAFFWFLKDGQNSIVAAARVIIVTTPDVRLPAQTGDVSLCTDCLPTHAGELSGIWFTDVTHVKALLALGAQWLISHFPEYLLFAIFDPENTAIKRLYLRTLQLQLFDHDPIVYNSITRNSDGMPVEWTIAADDPAHRALRIDSVMKSPAVRAIVQSVSRVT